MSDEDHIMDDQDVHEDTDDPRATGKKPEIDYEKDPIEVKKRVLALKKLQLETTLIEAKFFKEMHELEQKYLPLFQPFWEKRNLITTGKYEPKDDECYGLEELAEEMKAISLEKDKEKKESGETKGDDGNKNEEPTESKCGIPDFWVKIFGNVDIIAELLEENDIPVLQCLNDIKIEMLNDPMGFKLHFHFDENAWFTNKVLTKTYFMKCDPDPADPFAFEGTEIVKCIGCPIDWNKGKNLTVKVIKKKQKHKQRGSIRTIQKTVPIPSFFNFFSPPIVPEEGSPDSMDEETQMRLTNDFEIGQYIRERVVPRAVLFYTGEALDNEEEEDFEEEEDDDDDDDDDEEDSDADGNEEDESHVNPKNVRRSGGGAGGAGPDGPPNSKARAAQNRRMQKEKDQQECQQQ